MLEGVVIRNTMNIGCSTRAIRHLRQRFQATGRTEDRSRNGRPRVTTHGQDCYIRNTHQLSRFQTATATVSNSQGKHNILSVKPKHDKKRKRKVSLK